MMQGNLFSKIERFRYERKFFIAGLAKENIEAVLKTHPAVFREIYHERRVNNIYFDTIDYKYYFDNINGINRRLKTRIRWYGELFGFIKSPVLEMKFKHNLHVGKLQYPLKSFLLDQGFSINDMRQVVRSSSLSEVIKLHLLTLRFSLLNSYQRKYFLSSDRNYRVTIDSGMRIYKLFFYRNNYLHSCRDDSNTILEIKYNKLQDELANTISNYFPFRMTRSSKYVEGINMLHMIH